MNIDIDISKVTLETERLILRPWLLSDLDDFYEYSKVDGVGQMAGWSPHKNIEESAQILKVFIKEKKVFAIVLKETGKVIGSLGIEEVREKSMLASPLKGRELGYVLNKDFWGRGLMPEAVKKVIDYCFTDLDCDFLLCGYFQWNHQSQRVCEKAGFQFYKQIKFATRFATLEKTNLNIIYHPKKEIKK
ncbi:MAG TPA: GNAT family N-acetyltransferase [Bacilli bacterium]|jgi:ribosomal-protein-alanine N-acetyltransferase|nr:GNAT family N-acetyltransferase [Bacilli bacterium]HQM07708.1 GNAT family N-acetyltransferase [Bacilli bacterium]